MFVDRDWWKVTANMIADNKAQKQYLADVEWFIENHNESYNDKKKGRVKGYYSGLSIENTRLLERFRVYLQNKMKPKQQAAWLASVYAKLPIDRIVEYLTSLYASR